MANEAILRNKLGNVSFDWTVADGAGIEKGTIMKISADPRTAAAATADGDLFAGVAVREKIANDGRTRLALTRNGIFDMYVFGSATLGQPLKVSGANYVADADEAGAIGASEVVGIALETGASGDTIQVLVGAF